MDLCHCLHPKILEGATTGVCGWCHLYYDRSAWKKDSRVKAAKAANRDNIEKVPTLAAPDPYQPCLCGSGKKRKFCGCTTK